MKAAKLEQAVQIHREYLRVVEARRCYYTPGRYADETLIGVVLNGQKTFALRARDIPKLLALAHDLMRQELEALGVDLRE